jgi:RNA polymerase subunit RPABC4/transcription elongation factor Spt4
MSEPKNLCAYCGGSQMVERYDDHQGQILSEVCPWCNGTMFERKWPDKIMPEGNVFDAIEASMKAIEKYVRGRK